MSYIAPATFRNSTTQAPSVSGFFANNYGTRTTQSATARAPIMATRPNGNMSPNLKDPLDPIPPAAPTTPKVTEQPFDFYLNKERTRNGMLSTFLGRNLELPQTKMKQAGLSSYMNL